MWDREPRRAVVTLLDVINRLAACIATVAEAGWNEETFYCAVAFPPGVPKKFGQIGAKMLDPLLQFGRCRSGERRLFNAFVEWTKAAIVVDVLIVYDVIIVFGMAHDCCSWEFRMREDYA